MLYVDGRRAEALPKLTASSEENTSEQLSAFCARLVELDQLPGAAKFGPSLRGAAATLDRAASEKAKRGGEKKLAARDAAGEPQAAGRRDVEKTLSADTDPVQLRDGLEVSPTDAMGWCSHSFGEGTRCATIAQGPLYLTDAVPNGKECQGQFLAVLSGDALAGRFDSPLAIHGARIFVPSGSSLVFGQLPEPAEDESERPEKASPEAGEGEVAAVGKARVEDSSPEWSCLLYWSGFVPYRDGRH